MFKSQRYDSPFNIEIVLLKAKVHLEIFELTKKLIKIYRK